MKQFTFSRSVRIKFTLIILLILSIRITKAQCPVAAYANPMTISCGDTVRLTALANGTQPLNNNFNSGTIGTDWQATNGAAVTDGTGTYSCVGAPAEGPYCLWMGGAVAAPRNVTTNNYNLTAGGSVSGTICFDLRFGTQGGPGVCEGIDLPEEGVYLRYSTDGGVTWTVIQYFDPNGGYDPVLTSWNRYCITIPAAAFTTGTAFQWYQQNSSGAGFDTWGLDNMVITLNTPGYTYDWAHDSQGPSASAYTPPVVPLTNTTYTVTYTNGTAGNTCTGSVSVVVLLPTTTAIASPTTVCQGASVQLDATSALQASPPSACGGVAVACDPMSTIADEKQVGFGAILSQTGNPGIGYLGASNFDGAVRSQFLLKATDLIAAGVTPGKFISMQFDIATNDAGNKTFNDFEVTFMCTNLTALPDNYVSMATGAVVHTPKTISVGTGWKTIFFDQGYNWDGTTNLLINICWRSAQGATIQTRHYATSYAATTTDGTNTASNGGVWQYCADNSDPFTTNYNSLPNFKFGICKPRPGTLTYNWSSSPAGLSSTIRNPTATVSANTVYTVTVNQVGRPAGCAVTSTVNVNTIKPVVSISPSPAFICPPATSVALASTATTDNSVNAPKTFSNTTSAAVADGGFPCNSAGTPTNSIINVSGASPATLSTNPVISVTVNMTCANTGNYVLRLFDPAGNVITLFNKRGTGTALNNTVFSTTGPAISTGTGNFNSTYTPEQPFTMLPGSSPVNGNWKLEVVDWCAPLTGSSVGTLVSWSIKFKAPNAISSFFWSPSTNLSSTSTASTTASPTTTTNYNLTVIDNYGCSTTTPVTVNVGNIPAPTASNNGPLCTGGTLNLTTSAISGATYNWTGPSFTSTTQNPSISNVTSTMAGTYSVSATVGSCTSAAGTTTVVINAPPTVTVPANVNVCANGTVAATSFSSTPSGATYAWTNSNTAIGLAASGTGNISSFTATNSTGAAITATITVTPSLNGCSGVPSTYTITVNPKPTVTVPANVTACTNGTIAAANFTSTPTGASFAWTNSNTATGLAANGTGNIASFTATNSTSSAITSTITVTPTLNGCAGNAATYNITVNPNSTVTVPANITACANGAIAATSFTSTPSGATFSWTNSNTAIGLAASGTGNIAAFTATNNTTSSITSTITVTPTLNGCAGTPSSYTITVNPKPSVTVPSNITVCANGTVAATNFTSTPAGATYSWTNSNTAIGLAANGTGNIASFTATNSTGSAITSTITVTPTLNGCNGTAATYTITVNPKPAINPITNVNACANGTVAPSNFASTPTGATYNWTNSNTAIGLAANGTGNTPSFTATNSTASAISATVTVTPSLNGCTGTSGTYTITVNPLPTATISGGGSVCSGSTTTVNIVLTGTAPWAFTYSNGTTSTPVSGINTSPYVITTGTAGNYTVTSVSNTSCTGTASGNATVNVSTPITISNTNAVCNGANTDYTVTFEINGGDPASYSVMGGTGTITSSVPYIFTSNAIPSTSPNYSFTINDANNCASQTISGTQNCNCPATATVSGGGTICAGATTTVSIALTGTAPWSFTYTDGTNNTPVTGVNTSPYVITTGTAGNYSVTSMSDANCSGSASGSATVTVNPLPVATVSSDVIVCAGSMVTGGNFTSNPSGATFSWTNSNTGIGLAASGTGNIASYTATNNTSATITSTISVVPTLNNCTGNTASYTVTVNPNPTAVISGGSTICAGSTANINVALTGTAPWSIIYFDGSTANSISGINSSPYLINTGNAGTYTITNISDANCVGTSSGSATLSTISPITINNTSASCNAANTNYIVSFEITGGDPASYSVTGGTGTITSSAPYIFTSNPIPAATPNYSFTVNDSYNCSPQTVSGTQNCNCPATATVNGGGSACAGNTVSVNIDLAGTPPWSLIYSDGTTNVPVTGINSSPYIITASSSGTYTVVSVTDANCTGSSSGSATVTINPLPTAVVSGGGGVCSGSTDTVSVALTGTAPWSLTYFDGSSSTPVSGISNSPYQIISGNAGTYTVTAIADANCSGTASGNAVISNVPAISTGNLIASCNSANTNYTVSFEITGGDPASYNVTGGTGTISGSAPYIFTSNPIPSSTTNYSFTVTDTYNCTPQTISGTQNCNCPASATITGGGAICAGNTATINVTLTGTAPWSFTYSDGTSSTPVTGVNASPYVITTSTAGTYTITTMSDANCTGSSNGSAIVTVNPIPSASVSGGGTICPGSTSSINIALTGTAPWSFIYYDGVTNTPVSGITSSPYTINTGATGNYSVLAIADSNCSGTSSGNAVISNVAPIVVNNVTATCDPANTSYTVAFEISGGDSASYAVSGGTGTMSSSPFIFTSDAITSSNINYSFTVNDSYNCAPQTVSGIQNCNCPATATISGGGAFCAGSTTTMNVTLTGTAPWSFTYTDGTTSVPVTGVNTSPYVITTSNAGTYTITSMSDANCTGSVYGSATTTVNPVPSASVSGGGNICTGSTATVSIALTGIAPWSLTYSDGTTSTPVSGINSSVYTFTTGIAGTYSVTSISDANCTGTSSGTASVSNISPITLSNVTASCNVANTNYTVSFQITGGSSSTYTVTDGNGTVSASGSSFTSSAINATNLNYSYTVTDTNNCAAQSISGTQNCNCSATATISGGGTICSGNTTNLSVALTGTAPWSFTYSDGTSSTPVTGINTSPYVITTGNAGTYTITSMADASCTGSTSGSATVNVNPLPSVSVPSNIMACLNGTVPASNFTSTPAGATYSWTNSATSIGLSSNGTGNVPSFTANNPTSSPLTSTITVIPTLNGCAGASTTYTITVNPVPTASVSGGGTICSGGAANVNIALTGSSPWSFTYSNGSSTNSVTGVTTSPYTLPATTTGSYSVTAISDANCNGVSSGSAVVTQSPALNVSVNSVPPVCPGSPATLTATASGGNNGPYNYSWSNGTIGATLTVSPSATGNFTVTVNDGCSAASNYTATVTVHPKPNVVFTADAISGCAPFCVKFSDQSTPSGNITNWAWNFGNGNSSSIKNPESCFENAGNYSVGLTVTTNNGCTSSYTHQNMIKVNPLPVADFLTPVSTSILEPTIQFMDLSSPDAINWNWSFGDSLDNGSSSNEQNPYHTYSEVGAYCIKLQVTNSFGCEDTTTHCIYIDADPSFYIPNSFTPNDDGVNDIFTAKGENISEFNMSIFDRWGNKIYETNDITQGWNGKANNGEEVVMQEVYAYNVMVRNSQGRSFYYMGSVTLLK